MQSLRGLLFILVASSSAWADAGGCCLPNSDCVDVSPALCASLGGEFQGVENYCWQGEIVCDPTGRCCLPCPIDGSLCIEDQLPEECGGLGGSWLAYGSCNDQPCALLPDCNADGVPDACQELSDCNGNGHPDECEDYDDGPLARQRGRHVAARIAMD